MYGIPVSTLSPVVIYPYLCAPQLLVRGWWNTIWILDLADPELPCSDKRCGFADLEIPSSVFSTASRAWNGPNSLVLKDRLSDAGGLGWECQTGRVTATSVPSLWRDKHPAIKDLQPPEHHAGHSIRTKKTPPSKAATDNKASYDMLYP